MQEGFVVNPKFNIVSLLQNDAVAAVQHERVLENEARNELGILEDPVVDSEFDFARSDGDIAGEFVGVGVDGEFPDEASFGGLNVLADVVDDEIAGDNVRFGHFKILLEDF